jgi:hypothetical protein
MRRHRAPDLAGRTIDLLLSDLPALIVFPHDCESNPGGPSDRVYWNIT